MPDQVQGVRKVVELVVQSRGLDQTSRQTNRVFRQFDQQARAATRTSAAFGNRIQQVGFQVGDFATQVASGQNPLRAFIQQGTQLAGIFGPAGAIFGAAAASVGAIATALLDGGKAAEDSRKKFEELVEPVGSIDGAVNALTGVVNTYAEAIRGTGAAQADATSVILQNLGREFDARRRILRFATREEVLEQRQRRVQRQELQSQLDERRRLEADLAELGDRRGRAATERAGNIRGRLEELPAGSDLRQRIAQLDTALAVGAREIRLGFDALTEEFDRGVDELAKTRQNPGSSSGDSRGSDPTSRRAAPPPGFSATPSARLGSGLDFSSPLSLGRFGGGLFERANEGGREFADTLKGINLQQRQARQLGVEASATLGHAFENIVLGSRSASDAVRGLLNDLARLALRRLVLAPFINAAGGFLGNLLSPFGGGGGGFGFPGSSAPSPNLSGTGGFQLADGGVVSGFPGISKLSGSILRKPTFFPDPGRGRVDAFAMGGVLAGEADEEAIMPLKRTRGGRLGVEVAGGGGGTTIAPVYNIDARGADQGVVERIERVLDRHVRTHDQIVHGAVERGRRNRVLKS